jgi:hypothetical protein
MINDEEVTIMKGPVSEVMKRLNPQEQLELVKAMMNHETVAALKWLEGWMDRFDEEDSIDQHVLVLGVQVMTSYGRRLAKHKEKTKEPLYSLDATRIAKEVLEDLTLSIAENIKKHEKDKH